MRLSNSHKDFRGGLITSNNKINKQKIDSGETLVNLPPEFASNFICLEAHFPQFDLLFHFVLSLLDFENFLKYSKKFSLF